MAVLTNLGAVRAGWMALAVALSIAAVLVGGCSRKAPPSAGKQTGQRGGRLVLGIHDEPNGLNSILEASQSGRLVENALFSRFVAYDDSMRLVPDLLTEIPTRQNGGVSLDDLTYTYHLCPEARWHDGEPLTSADVVFTYQQIMDPKAGAESQQGFDVVDHVETPDPHTVVFRLREPYASFVADTFSDEDVLPKHVLEAHAGAAFAAAPFNHAPVGSGPFQFKEWVPGSHITLVRFDGYYGGAPNLDEIVFVVVPDANALALRLQAGEVQGYFGAEASQRGMLQKLPGVRLYATPSLLCDHLDFNCETPPLDDARVRRALALATDRDAIARHVYEGLAQAARADMHPLLPWYNPMADTASAFDPARARALLASAGWRDTNGDSLADRDGRPLRLMITTTAGRPDRERTEQVLQQEWKRIGVDLVIRNAVPGVFFGTLEEGGLLRNGKFDVALYSWGQTPDPSGLETVYSSKSVPPAGQNMGRFRNARVDSLTALGARVADTAQRVRIYHDLEAILLREVPVVPLVWHVNLDPMTDRLHEFRPNATASGDTWNVRSWWLSPSAP